MQLALVVMGWLTSEWFTLLTWQSMALRAVSGEDPASLRAVWFLRVGRLRQGVS